MPAKILDLLKEFAAKEKLEIDQSERVASAGRAEGWGLGGIPPAPLQILAEICSNFFERTPPKTRISLFVSSESQEDSKTHYPCETRSRAKRLLWRKNERSE